MTKHPLAVISLLAFLIGGAAAVILNYPTRHTAASRQVAETPADAALETTAATDTPVSQPAEVEHAEEGTTSDDSDDPAAPPEETSGEAENGLSESAPQAGNSSNGMRRRPATGERAAQNSPAPQPYVRVSRRQTNPGGRVAGYTVGGVKKTGQGVKKAGTTIGRTFGKIGGVFND